MTTARTVIKRALRRLAVTTIGQEPSAEEASDGLEALNDMLHGLKGEGGDVGFATLTLNDDLPVAREYIKPIVDLLMRELAPEFGVTLTVNQAEAASSARRILQAAFSEIPVLTIDRGLRNRLHDHGDETF